MNETKTLSIKTCESCYDTTLSVFSSSTNDCNLSCVTSNDDCNICTNTILQCNEYSSLWSQATFCAQQSNTYWIFMGGYSITSSGDFKFEITDVGGCNPPQNDRCDTAGVVTFPSTVTADLTNSYASFYECGANSEGQHSVWYTLYGDGNYISASSCSIGTPALTTLLLFEGFVLSLPRQIITIY